jgi:hypothetical protein
MAKNLGREFATMTDEERRQFALEQGQGPGGPAAEEAADELDIRDPRASDAMGPEYPSPTAEVADPDARDGEAALLDDEAHERRVDERKRQKGKGSAR